MGSSFVKHVTEAGAGGINGGGHTPRHRAELRRSRISPNRRLLLRRGGVSSGGSVGSGSSRSVRSRGRAPFLLRTTNRKHAQQQGQDT